jgi:hypothetical protein
MEGVSSRIRSTGGLATRSVVWKIRVRGKMRGTGRVRRNYKGLRIAILQELHWVDDGIVDARVTPPSGRMATSFSL